MFDLRSPGLTRRRALAFLVALPGAILAACSLDGRQASGIPGASDNAATPFATDASPATPVADSPAAVAVTLAPTPACTDDDDDVTPPQTEGPFYTPDTPERTALRETGMAGTPLTVSGLVLSTKCEPVAGALIDFWQADDGGNYDNVGFRLRGHQFADDAGRFTLDTIVPGLYPGRTRHIHVKVQAPNRPVLTTQLYFPGEPRNDEDVPPRPANGRP